jgi:hypothetical protein
MAFFSVWGAVRPPMKEAMTAEVAKKVFVFSWWGRALDRSRRALNRHA